MKVFVNQQQRRLASRIFTENQPFQSQSSPSFCVFPDGYAAASLHQQCITLSQENPAARWGASPRGSILPYRHPQEKVEHSVSLQSQAWAPAMPIRSATQLQLSLCTHSCASQWTLVLASGVPASMFTKESPLLGRKLPQLVSFITRASAPSTWMFSLQHRSVLL